jgi:hypothetical protein
MCWLDKKTVEATTIVVLRALINTLFASYPPHMSLAHVQKKNSLLKYMYYEFTLLGTCQIWVVLRNLLHRKHVFQALKLER